MMRRAGPPSLLATRNPHGDPPGLRQRCCLISPVPIRTVYRNDLPDPLNRTASHMPPALFSNHDDVLPPFELMSLPMLQSFALYHGVKILRSHHLLSIITSSNPDCRALGNLETRESLYVLRCIRWAYARPGLLPRAATGFRAAQHGRRVVFAESFPPLFFSLPSNATPPTVVDTLHTKEPAGPDQLCILRLRGWPFGCRAAAFLGGLRSMPPSLGGRVPKKKSLEYYRVRGGLCRLQHAD